MASVCPVVGTTNTALPPNHPDVDLAKDGQTCPVVGAKTEHHHNLHQHPSVQVNKDVETPTLHTASAAACPALKNVVNDPKSKAMDDEVCPVIGPATTILPPDHPSVDNATEEAVCPVTKASIGHHKGKVHGHPSLLKVEHGAVCPVAGARV